MSSFGIRSFGRAACVALILLIVQVTHAFVVNQDEFGHSRRWILSAPPPSISTNIYNPASRAIRYFVAADGHSRTNRAAELNAVRACFDQWQSVPETSVRFEEGGLAASPVDVNPSDQTNLVFWANESTLVNGGRDSIFGTLAVTFPRLTEDNVLLEADIVLNGAQFAWSPDSAATNSAAQFIEGSVLHEIGHFLGLDHSPVGGATMFARGIEGINTQAGLSSDEMAAVRTLYPALNGNLGFGTLRGQVTLEASGVFGASVLVEDSTGHLTCGTVTRFNGFYEFPRLVPGAYQVRVTPLDPPSNNSLARLITGADISPVFTSAETSFRPTANVPIAIAAGSTGVLDMAVSRGQPLFRITRITGSAQNAEDLRAINAPLMVRLGQSNVVVGVCSPDLVSGSTLKISGDGLIAGPSSFIRDAFPGSIPALDLISMAITVAPEAKPGLRSFVVQHGTNLAYANGFLEILPRFPDNNFDGLDDTFQRRYFALFTAAEAGLKADPDADGFENRHEYVAGSDPVNAQSALRIDQVKWTTEGSAITWQSEPGKRYQLFSRFNFAGDLWTPAGEPVTASGRLTSYFDRSGTNAVRFYQVQVLP